MSDEPTYSIRKIGYSMYVPYELLIDEGVITEEEALAQGWVRPEPIHVPWPRRLRWAWQTWRYEHAPRLHFGPCDHGDCI